MSEIPDALGTRLIAVMKAAEDRRLAGLTMQVYTLLALESLSFQDFRAVKHAFVAKRLSVHKVVVSKRMKLLLDLGYLERDSGAFDGRLVRYRLVPPQELQRPAA